MSEKTLAPLSKEAQGILDAVKTLSVLELSNLVKHMEEEFGVSAAAPVAAAAPAAAGASAPAEKTAFTVQLKNAGAGKINVIKVVKDITGLGLKEAKDLVDGAPAAVKENLPKAEAEAIAKQLKDAGADVELI